MFILFILLLIIILVLTNKDKSKYEYTENRKYNKASILGKIGENRVAVILERLSSKYYIFNDVYLLINGKTVQIDHLVISVYGIFVIETKNYSGWIYGNDSSEYWIENKYGKKYQFYNPLKQNYSHIICLKKLLGFEDKYFIPIVVFSGEAELKIRTKELVVYLEELEDVILRYNTPIFSELTVGIIQKKILKSLIKDERIEEFHSRKIRENLWEKDRKINKKICPKCGGKLVECNGRYGKFIGCNNYPKCKFTLKL